MNPNISKSLIRKNFSSQESPKKPNWIKVKVESENAVNLRKKLKANRVITVCEEAMCPNLSDCWSKNHATFMILGDLVVFAILVPEDQLLLIVLSRIELQIQFRNYS